MSDMRGVFLTPDRPMVTAIGHYSDLERITTLIANGRRRDLAGMPWTEIKQVFKGHSIHLRVDDWPNPSTYDTGIIVFDFDHQTISAAQHGFKIPRMDQVNWRVLIDGEKKDYVRVLRDLADIGAFKRAEDRLMELHEIL